MVPLVLPLRVLGQDHIILLLFPRTISLLLLLLSDKSLLELPSVGILELFLGVIPRMKLAHFSQTARFIVILVLYLAICRLIRFMRLHELCVTTLEATDCHHCRERLPDLLVCDLSVVCMPFDGGLPVSLLDSLIIAFID
mmetsp:Transcript_13038/g.15546  ORF Transcript_13038/g.15546 Transcript_13038/m.15546 type:complete len:140 (+) Transcript_13038:125-544(+)